MPLPLRPCAAFLAAHFAAAAVLSAPAPASLRITSYNLESYVASDRLTPDGFQKDYPKPEAAKRALHEVLRAADADVLALQEMGPQPYLEELQRDLAAIGLPYPYSVLVEAADADRHIALLSRVPLKQANAYRHVGFAYFGAREEVKRGALEAVFETAAGDVSVWVVHLKSRFTDRPDDPSSALRRASEAVALRDLILRRHPDPARAAFVVVGDFNDGRTRRPVQALQVRGKTTIATLLDAADSRGERWTHFYRREETYERVDHILVSPALMRRVRRDQHGEPAARIVDAPAVADASDHRPVSVTLDLAPAPAAPPSPVLRPPAGGDNTEAPASPDPRPGRPR